MNFRNLSRYSDYSEKSYSRWFRKEFNFTDLNSHAIIKAIPPLTEPIAIMDCTFVSKSGKKTYGLDRFYNSKHNRSEKGLEVSLFFSVLSNLFQQFSLFVDPRCILFPALIKDSYAHWICSCFHRGSKP